MRSRYTECNACLARKFSVAAIEEASCHAMNCSIERATWPGGHPARNQNPQSGGPQGTARHQPCYLEADLPPLSLRRDSIQPKFCKRPNETVPGLLTRSCLERIHACYSLIILLCRNRQLIKKRVINNTEMRHPMKNHCFALNLHLRAHFRINCYWPKSY